MCWMTGEGDKGWGFFFFFRRMLLVRMYKLFKGLRRNFSTNFTVGLP